MSNIIDTVNIMADDGKKLGHLVFLSNSLDKYLLQGFSGRSKRHDFYYRYKTKEDMLKKAREYIDRLKVYMRVITL